MSRIGVLALQGDVGEHVHMLESLGADALGVKKADQLLEVDALILPGGESTTIAKMAVRFGLIDPIRSVIDDGLPVYGTCAGMILLASTISDGDQPVIGA
ncbi:MAG: pyridoxal 5'-phosphate synthase glutaminase subunit PdxT, partial [Acidimicrobiia bacterium]